MCTFRLTFPALALLVAMNAAPLAAAPTYQYRFDQSNYSVAPSGTVPVLVYLRENYTSGDTTLLDSEGLFGTGVRVNFNIPNVPSQPAKVLAPGDITYNSTQFNGFSLLSHVPNNSAGFTATIGFLSPPATGTAGPGYYELYLGTFNFTAGAAPGQITNISAGDFGVTQDNIVDNGPTFTILDALIANANATITVQGVAELPEPSTWALWLLVAAMGVASVYRTARRGMARNPDAAAGC